MKTPCQRFRGDEAIRTTIGRGLEINADGRSPGGKVARQVKPPPARGSCMEGFASHNGSRRRTILLSSASPPSR